MSNTYTITDRIIELIDCSTDPQRKFSEFEEITGIKRQTWQNVANKRQKANEDLLEVIGRIWPQYAYWLMTGNTDEKNGHTSPVLERIARDLKSELIAQRVYLRWFRR